MRTVPHKNTEDNEHVCRKRLCAEIHKTLHIRHHQFKYEPLALLQVQLVARKQLFLLRVKASQPLRVARDPTAPYTATPTTLDAPVVFSCSTQGAVAALAAAFTWRDRHLRHKSTLAREAKLVDLRKWNIDQPVWCIQGIDTAHVDRKQENRPHWDGKDSVTLYQTDQSEP